MSIPGGLNWFLQLFVLDLFVFDVLVYRFYICFENLGSVYYFYELIENNFFVFCYSLNFYFVNYLVIYFDNYCNQIFGDLICCLKYLKIDYYIVDFDYSNSFCFYC